MRILITLCAFLLLPTMSRTATPQQINYQGRLTDSLGAPVVDGPYSVVFTVYDSAVSGTSVWTETQNVNTSKGLFAVLLGAVAPILDTVFNGPTRYLGIKIAGEPELTPRTALVSVPWAFRVSTVNGASGGNITSKVSIGAGHTNAGVASFVAGMNNNVTGDYSSVGGGTINTASSNCSTVSGGCGNTAGERATVCGGGINSASGYSATIGGGESDTASGDMSAIGGGLRNIASGVYATIPGGRENVASNRYTFAAGYRAKAIHLGAFVWGDFSAGDLASSAANQFTVRSSGGIRFFSNSALTTGVTLAAGGGAWATVSDSTVKENIRPVDGAEILRKISQLDVSRWNYETQDASIEHIGPMAQDFYRLFGVGDNSTTITTIDPDGVSLAAIKTLYERSKRVDELEKSNQELNQRLDKLEELMRALTKK